MPYHPQMRTYNILSGFNRFPMAKNLGNKKKFAQIGQQTTEILENKVSGSSGGPGGPKRGSGGSKNSVPSLFVFLGPLSPQNH